MTLQTPNKNVDVLQVPGSSPAAPPLRPELSAKDREATRKRFHSHVHWPVLRKRFYYLEEAELFKAMVKGKGNLRDTSLWIAENIKLTQRLQEYERREQQQKSRETAGADASASTHASSTTSAFHNASPSIPSVVPRNTAPQSMAPAFPSSLSSADFYGPPKTVILHTSEPYPSKNDYKFTPAAAASSNDEDTLLVKKPGNARQKRVLPSVEAPRPAPDTKVHLLKPKVSILEKYRSRQQPRIDYLFQRLNSLDTKKRKLVRASADAQSLIPLTGSVSPSVNSSVSQLLLSVKPGALTAAFGYTGDDIPRLKGSSAAEVDELEILERRIRDNRKNKASRRADSDAELEEEVYSDDMSEEDDPDRPSGAITFIDGQILEFLNQASAQDIIEICNISPKAAELLIGKRPFITIHEIAEERLEGAIPETEGKRKYQRKPLGLKIVESAESSLKGYKAVDSLVKKCSEYGNLISRQMVRWGVKVTGEGELSVVDVEVQDGEAGEDVKILEESAVTDMSERTTSEIKRSEEKSDAVKDVITIHDDGDDDDIGTERRSIPYIKHKPTLLAEDVDLKSYQQVGLNWLHLLYHHKLSCILADEMGLGKTCQVIAFMAHLKAVSADSGPHLVVVPASTLENWLREFQKFCPTLEVQAYYGSQPEREDLRYELAESHFDVLVTTYNLATGSPPDLKFLKSQAFDVIVYDEGHMLKNSNSERYNKLMRLKARFRLLLTGTPLQNNLKELVSLLAFVLPKVFVEKRDDLQVLFNKKASVDATGDFNPLLSQQAINKAKNMMTPFVLRRKKFQVLKHLPGKTHHTIRCDMTAKQREIYDSYISQGKETRLERERRKTMTAKELEGLVPIASTSNVMMALRKAAMHPLLFRTIYTDDTIRTMAKKIMNEPEYVSANRGYIVEDMQVMSDYELNALCEKFPSTIGEYVLHRDTWLDSGKTSKLLEVVRAVIAKGEKVLVFSLFTQMLDILESVLSFASIAFLRLDGQTSVDTRQDIIDRFYEDASIPVFLLSTKAGGFGINLVAANNVVIFDQSFNPHDDKQAEDRAHRVGQSSEVYVTRLISNNTIDENILMLAENKLQLDHSISNDSASKFEEKAVSMFESILFK